MLEPREFHVPPGARFSCNSCGKCCSSGFEISVQNRTAELIKQSTTYLARTRDGYQPLRVVDQTTHFLNTDQDDRCQFLEHKLCALHKNEGLSHKPLICQIYPYNLVQGPNGIHVSLLYSCPTVVAGDGACVEENVTSLSELFAAPQTSVPTLGPIQDHILITQRSTVTWPQYLELEKALWTHLDHDDPVFYLVKAACHLAGPKPHLVRFDRDSRKLEWVLNGPFESFVTSMRDHLQGRESQTLIPMLKPKTSQVKETIVRFLQNQLHGKLLVIGPSLVARLILVASGLVILLDQMGKRQDNPLEQLQQSFAFIEERVVSQSNAFESGLLEFEEYLLDLS